jgi:hypothetical protein
MSIDIVNNKINGKPLLVCDDEQIRILKAENLIGDDNEHKMRFILLDEDGRKASPFYIKDTDLAWRMEPCQHDVKIYLLKRDKSSDYTLLMKFGVIGIEIDREFENIQLANEGIDVILGEMQDSINEAIDFYNDRSWSYR